MERNSNNILGDLYCLYKHVWRFGNTYTKSNWNGGHNIFGNMHVQDIINLYIILRRRDCLYSRFLIILPADELTVHVWLNFEILCFVILSSIWLIQPVINKKFCFYQIEITLYTSCHHLSHRPTVDFSHSIRYRIHHVILKHVLKI